MARRLRPVAHEDRLSLVEHLTELRVRLIVALVAFCAATAVCMWQNHTLLDILNRPLEPGSNADFEINAMWVAPELRGQGIGEALLDAALAAAGSAGARTVRLWVTNGNDGALALYTRRGFLPTGRTEPLLSDPQLTVAEYVSAAG